MKPREIILEATLKAQINQIEKRIEELRLETIPDVEMIRRYEDVIKKMRDDMEILHTDEVPVA